MQHLEVRVTTPERALAGAEAILVVDWPSRDVPETLTRAGYTVLVKGGPEPDNFSAWELRDAEVVVVKLRRRLEGVDIVYAHRPVAELPGIVTLAGELGATTVWCQSGLSPGGARDLKGCWLADDDARQARAVVERAGLHYVDAPYIADLARDLRINR
jgi:predicted CoA-binding protein